MRVFITGGAGFIGSHLCDALIAQGHQVSILDNMSTGSAANIAHIENAIEIHQGDIRDVALVEKLMAPADLILHMAAALGVNTILENPIESVSINLTGSEVVLNAATKLNKRLIIASTSEIYGKNTKQPLNEESDRVVGAPQKIRWTYSDAKALEEAIAHALFLTKQLKVTTVRLFNTVGPRQTGQYGMVLPRFVTQALSGEPITVYGDGTQSRSFTYVGDVVDALVALAAEPRAVGQVFNIGNAEEISIRALAERVRNLAGSASSIVTVPYDEAYEEGFEDMPRRVPDISRIQALVGFTPRVPLDEIIRRVIAFHRGV